MAPSDPSVRYRNGKDGLRRSTDGGQQWAAADRPPHAHLHALAISPHDPALLYTTAGDVMRPKSVWRSRDGARTWTRVDQCSESPLTFTCDVIFDPNDANTVYVRTRNESPSAGWETVRRSIDGGSTWQDLQTPKAVVWLLVVLPTTPTTLFVDIPGGAPDARHTLWKSTDRGDHWRRSDAGLPSGNPVTAIAMDPQRHSKLVAGTDGRGVFLSNDGGATWRPTRPRLASPER
jgi:photosystem II stability/assembly factor-like uncharacterized protein